MKQSPPSAAGIVGVSSKDIQRARQNAKRKRSSSACIPCKMAKVKCNDYRPCSRCCKLGAQRGCMDSEPTPDDEVTAI